jgi:hypothetical protein
MSVQTERSPLVKQTFTSYDVDNALIAETNNDLQSMVEDLTALNDVIKQTNEMFLFASVPANV